MPAASDRPSPTGLVVLSLLAEAPMHPYGLHRLMVERGKTAVVSVPTRATLYQLLERLDRAGLVARASTERAGSRPDRTLYLLTDAGRGAARVWLLDYLAGGSQERPGFIAALASMMFVSPQEALQALRTRRGRLITERASIVAEIEAGTRLDLPKLFQLDEHYRLQHLDLDLTGVDELIDDLASGRLTWSLEYIAEIARRVGQQDAAAQPPAAGGVSRDSRSSSV